MRHTTKDEELPEELGSRKGLLVGLIAAIAVVVVAIFVILAFLQAKPRQPRPTDLPISAERGRKLSGGSSEGRKAGVTGPRNVPDGGWPEEPRSLELMDQVPTGVLRRGSPGEQGEEDEAEAGDLLVQAFYIDKYEVTNEQYLECVNDGVCQPSLELDPERFGAARQPVVGVSWYDATTYCRWAGKRLPTEAEWERAARGDDRREYPWGEGSPTCDKAIFTQCDRYGPAEVGGRPEGAGPFGTQDLAGNVWEWVQDWYAPRYYPSKGENAPEGPPAGQQRVLRGGSWHFGPMYIRAANRHRDDPVHRTPSYGFRCAYSPPPPQPPPIGPDIVDAGSEAGIGLGIDAALRRARATRER